MREAIIAKLQKIEENLQIYNRYVQSPQYKPENKNVVSFRMLFDMMTFGALWEFVPDYKAKVETMELLGKNLAGTAGMVDVVNGQIVISPAYNTILAKKEEFVNKQKDNGKVD